MLKKHDFSVAYALLATGAIQLILLFAVMLGFSADPLTRFLYSSFHIAAIYIPGLQFWGAYLIIKKPFNIKTFYYSVASIVIFFPFATLVKLVTSDKRDPVINFLQYAFDTPDRHWGSILILFSIIVILLLTAKIVVKGLMGETLIEDVENSNPLEVEDIDDTDSNDVEDIVEVKEDIKEDLSVETDVIQENILLVKDEDVVEDDIVNEVDDFEDEEYDYDIEEESHESLSGEISKIKQEINEYYFSNVPFEEPKFPETSEEVDIDAFDKSNSQLEELVNIELSKEESDYLDSFDEVETFSADSSELFQEDPGLAFLADDSKDFYNEDSSDEYDKVEYVEVEENSSEDIASELDEEEFNSHDDYINDSNFNEPEQETNTKQDEEISSQSTGRVLEPQKPTYDELNRSEDYTVPVSGILGTKEDHSYEAIDDATKRSAAILEQTLEEFNIKGKVTGIKKGPVITMFELLPAPGVKLSKIVNLSDNIALRLAASTIRIVAPIPGKHAVGIEVPNKNRAVVTFSELIESEDDVYEKSAVPIVLGKSINGDKKIIDLAKTPHLLIAGATGAGKSVCVNSLICSILYKRSHNDVKLIMVDPKIVELKLYNGIPHLLTPVITDPKKAFQAIQWCLYEMERRYALLDALGVRDISSYNKRIKEQKIATTKLPYLVLIVDEFADLMATSGKELEGILARLAAMSRAVGIHLVLATQRPSIDVITGLIKANFPSRIAFMVSSKTDSRIILDGMGAEKLLGRGDMLFTSSWEPFPVRIQGSFLSDEEVESVVDYVKTLGEPEYIDDEIFIDEDDDDGAEGDDSSFFGDDPLFNRALEIIINANKASASFLQRRLKIGYNRAARLVEEMEERGIIGPQNGSKPREILRIPDSHREVSEYVS